MRFQVRLYRGKQGFAMILAALLVYGMLISTSVCLSAGDEWVKKANMPTARDSLSASVVDGKIYVIGGWVPNT